MPNTLLNMLPPDTIVPVFRLKDTNSNNHYSYQELKGSKGTLIMFIGNNCPFVDYSIDEIIMIANDYRVQGIGMIAISSSDYLKEPLDSPELMAEYAFKNKIDFPYLHDESQQAARDFSVSYTPDFFLFDRQDQLSYHGQMDDSRPGNGVSQSGSDLRKAIDAVLYNRTNSGPQKPSNGCSIKWK